MRRILMTIFLFIIYLTHHVGNVAGALPHAIPVRVPSWKINRHIIFKFFLLYVSTIS